MMLRLVYGTSAMLICLAACADDRPAPPGIVWKGSVSIGTELDEHALPREGEETPAKTPGRIRVGFSATWSFSLNWERVESLPDENKFEAPELSPEEAKLIELTNAERKKLKLAPLKPDPVLMKLARAHAATMARLDQIGHDLDGKTFSQRMEQANYQALRAGENIGKGHKSPAEAVASWMLSPGHKGNILEAEYTQIGVAKAASKSGKTYWTQVFAKP